ncbi:MAG: glycosyltransferase family 4 protein [Acidobacteriota bacterium]|nr:glycosyltransferase family 4 protein [Acidobacteriota bacterium]
MRVCLDCFPFLVRSAGVKAYLFELHRHLRRIAGPENVHSFPFLDHVESFHHEGSVLGPAATALRFGILFFSNLDHNPVLDLLGRRIDVFHASNQVRNPPRNAKLTTTIHDMTAWSHPELHRAATVTNDKRWAERIVRRADAIVTPSESSRQDAIRWLGLPPERVTAIHHGVGHAYFSPKPDSVAAARTAFQLNKPYILFVSTIEPRKNLDRLLDAYEALPQSIRGEYDLAVSGPRGWSSEHTAARLVSGIPGVRALGYVPETLLPGLVAGATVFAYPSLYEGFGFPVAQAMAAGAPVLTSNVSSLPEITGGAAVLVDPLSTSEITAALTKLLLSPTFRVLLSSLGRDRARHFRWERCAQETWRFFERVCFF